MTTYAAAGVDLNGAESFSSRIAEQVGRLFGGIVPVEQLKRYEKPLLVSSMDGVGTKTRLALKLGDVRGLGTDIVHHCVNDIAVHGAEPLFFMDYLGFHRLEVDQAERIVNSIRRACDGVGIALVGGETAEMRRVYQPDEIDVVGVVVGAAEAGDVVDGSTAEPGDLVLGLPSSGPHTNGFSLLQEVFMDSDYVREVKGEDRSLGEVLLEPHRCYLKEIRALLETGCVRGFAHITGGGLAGNLSRIIPVRLQAVLDTLPRWPPVFQLIYERGVARDEMLRVFNLGVGLVAVCAPFGADKADPEWKRLGYVRESSAERRVDIHL